MNWVFGCSVLLAGKICSFFLYGLKARYYRNGTCLSWWPSAMDICNIYTYGFFLYDYYWLNTCFKLHELFRRDLLVIVDASKDDHYIKLSFFRDLICGKHLETWTEEAQNHGCLLDLPFAFVQDNFWLLICESSTFFYSSVIGFVSFEFIGELGCHLEIFSVFLLPLMMNIMKLSFFRDVPCGKPLETWTEEAQEPWAIICVPIPCRLGFLYNMRS